MEVTSDAIQRYRASFADRGFKAERHIDRNYGWPPNFGAFTALENQGMQYWFEHNPGYNEAIVTDFYKNMSVPDSLLAPEARIVSSIGKTAVYINANKIAHQMGYARPDGDFNFPAPEDNPITVEDVKSEIYEHPADYSLPHKPGKLTSTYKVLNQVVCFNLYPRGGENKPSEYVGQVMFALGDPDTICDWALFMFCEMAAVRGTNRGRLPFPCLLTRIFQAEGITGGRYAPMARLNPGTIGADFLTRSSGQVRAMPRPLHARPSKGATTKAWLKKIFCQNVAIMQSHTKLKKEQRQIARTQLQMSHEMHYLRQRVDNQASSSTYVPLELPEQEVSDDFAGEGIEEESEGAGDEGGDE